VIIPQKPLVEKIVEHRDFFTRLNGYDEDLLCDINDELGEEKIGLLLLDPAEILKSLVFDQNTVKKIHEEASIPPKKQRADLAGSAVLISDARLIARNIAGLRTENKKKIPRRKTPPHGHETPRREAMPQSLPEGFAPARTRKATDRKEILDQWRRDVENNTELSAKTSEEILENLRSVVQRRKEAKIHQ
jgi:hypothetical protein